MVRRRVIRCVLPALLLVAGLLGPAPATAQETDEPGVVSFFASVASGLSRTETFAIDARSFALQLRGHLSEALTVDVVEALLGSEFRYGPIDRWVTCDGTQPCQMAYTGTHIALLRVTPNDDGDELVLRLGRSGGDDGGVWHAFESLRVRQVDGRWRLVDGS